MGADKLESAYSFVSKYSKTTIWQFFFQDGSGRGAALVAAVLKRDDNNEEQDIKNGN